MLPNKQIAVLAILIACFSVAGGQAAMNEPNLPADFPELVVTQYGETAPGVFIGWLGWWVVDYYVVLDQSGYPLFYSKTEKMSYPGVMSNGLLSAPAIRGFSLKDETFAIVDSFQLEKGYGVDIHDFKLLPNGGEQWLHGLKYFIQWDDNLSEDLVIELYKGDAPIKTIAEVSSIGAYEWEVDLDLEPGADYSIKIKSSSDDVIFDQSAGVFSIE